MPLGILEPLQAQRHAYQLGRLRLGVTRPSAGGRPMPVALSTVAFTTRLRAVAESAARTYGGVVTPWLLEEGAPTAGQWRVLSEATEVPVIVPPGDGILSQWWESWSPSGRCRRRCDGTTEQLRGGPCACPQDLVVRAERAAEGKACRPVTRLTVRVPDVAGVGVWRLDSHGLTAAVELADAAAVLAEARAAGVAVPATLRIEVRTSVTDDGIRRYVVPVLSTTWTVREIAQARGTHVVFPVEPEATRAPAPRGRWDTVTTPQQCARRLASLRTPDAVLSLHRYATGRGWLTDPQLAAAFQVRHETLRRTHAAVV